MNIREIASILSRTFSKWSEHDAQTLGAALSYYTVLSLAPLLVIAISIAGLVFGQKAAQGEIVNQINGLIGPSGAQAIQDMLAHAKSPKAGVIATIIGFIVLFFGASGVFTALRKALNRIWEVQVSQTSTWWALIKDEFFSFTMIVGIGFLLLVSLVASAVLSAFGHFVGGLLPGVFQGVNWVISMAVITLLFAVIYRVVPQQSLPWRGLWIGSFATAVLFTLGKYLLGLYLGKAGVGSAYGAAGSLIVLFVWVYYSSQLFLFGAEFTRLYACARGLACLNVDSKEAKEEPATGGKKRNFELVPQPGLRGWHRKAGTGTAGERSRLRAATASMNGPGVSRLPIVELPPTRPFAWTDEQIPVVGQGTWLLEHAAREAAIHALKTGIEIGMTLIDTAEMYGNGTAEEIVRHAIHGQRERIFLVTKVLPSNASYDGTLRACERSLSRLDVSSFDLYLLHWESNYPIGETMRAMEALVSRGLIRYIGVSNFDLPQLRQAEAALTKNRLACNQVLYHLRDRGIERRLLPYCREREIAIMGYSPFGHTDFPKPNTAGARILDEVGQRHKKTARQVALCFLTSHGVFAIPKAADAEHVRENSGGAGWSLTAEEYAIIDRAFPAPDHDVPLGII